MKDLFYMGAMRCARSGLIAVLAVVMVQAVFAQTIEAPAPSTDFEYEAGDDAAVIKKYLGNARKVVIPSRIKGKPVTAIGEGAFKDFKTLEEVVLPKNLKSIGNLAFSGCAKLKKINITGGITIADNAFTGTAIQLVKSGGSTSGGTDVAAQEVTPASEFEYQLNKSANGVIISGYTGKRKVVVIPEKIDGFPVVEFTHTTFVQYSGTTSRDTKNLTTVIIPNSIKSIPKDAFENCTNLTSVTIPNSVKEIGVDAFSGCKSLKSITIPNGMKKIEDHTFYHCESLTSVIIPNSVTTIDDSAFSDCKSLTSITIPNSVTSIGGSAFSNCSSLTSIILPKGLDGIAYWAFRGCSSLTSVTIPNSVKFIGQEAFQGCSNLTSITIPDSVTDIQAGAFQDCKKLASVTISPVNNRSWRGSYMVNYVIVGATRIEDVFKGCTALSLAEQAKLRKAGYTGDF